MIRFRVRHQLRHQDDGVAMIFVIAIGLVVAGLVVAMMTSVLQTQSTTRQHRNITSAQDAAEAGLDDAVFQLGQYDSSGNANWASLPSQWTQSSQHTQNFGSHASYSVYLTQQVGTSNLIVWSKGTYGSNTRTVRAVVQQGYPAAFDYSLFASKGIDIHHHNSSWLSPQVWTTNVHSNGYINIDYSAEFTVQKMEAVGALTMQKGGGSTPSYNIPTTGYNWYDPLNKMCYPGGIASPGGTAPSNLATNPPTCPNSYSGQAAVAGTIYAGSVNVGSRGEVLPVSSAVQLDTGQVIPAANGDVYASSVTVGGTTYTSQSQANTCTTYCNRNGNVAAGQINGALHITPGYAPASIAFPSIDYSNTYRALAQKDQDDTNQTHVFAGSGAFLNYITNPANGYYRTISPVDHSLQPWTSGAPQVIYLNGNYDIEGGSLVLNYGTIKSLVNAATNSAGAAPVLVIQGSLVVETGGITLNSGLVMVGAGNETDFLNPGSATTPVTVDTTKLLGPASMPAVLAAGGSIDSNDYDTDSNWTANSAYEPAKATPIYIRGLVYSASYNSTTKTSTPQNQHWHNYDPKNLMKIYGAQVGATLHDCNNFSFSYDPLVRKAFGFGGGTVKIIDYQELGN